MTGLVASAAPQTIEDSTEVIYLRSLFAVLKPGQSIVTVAPHQQNIGVGVGQLGPEEFVCYFGKFYIEASCQFSFTPMDDISDPIVIVGSGGHGTLSLFLTSCTVSSNPGNIVFVGYKITYTD